MPTSTEHDQLAEAVARLRATPLDDFLAARKAIAAELKGAGHKDAAKVVAAIRKPTAAAWGVAQLAHRAPEEVEQLVALGDELRAGQRRALSTGQGGDALREASARRRALVATLTDAAARALDDAGKPASSSTRDEIAATLEAAVLDPEVAAQVAVGALDRATVAPAGFGPLEHLTLVPADKEAPPERPATKRPAPARRTTPTVEPAEPVDDAEEAEGSPEPEPAPARETAASKAKRAAAAKAVADAEDERDELAAASQRAQAAALDARRAERDAEREADRLEEEAKAARRAAHAATTALAQATRTAERAADQVEKAERRVATAQARLEALDG